MERNWVQERSERFGYGVRTCSKDISTIEPPQQRPSHPMDGIKLETSDTLMKLAYCTSPTASKN
jgi:hypothetical protein